MKGFLSTRVMMMVLIAVGALLVLPACAGSAGSQGVPGSQGTQGAQGAQGLQGIQGPQGIQGEQGIAGISGGQGDAGAIGATGPQGTQGNRGMRGIAGKAGAKGANGPTLPVGVALSSSSQAVGTLNLTLYGSGYTASSSVTLQLQHPDGSVTSLGTASAGANGAFSQALTTTTSLTDGMYAVWATQGGVSVTAPLAVGTSK